MRKPTGLQKVALAITKWIGSPESVIVHSIAFVIGFTTVLLNIKLQHRSQQ